MCVEVAIHTKGKQVMAETKAQLREALGIEPIMLKGHANWPDDGCLCSCDIDETAAAAGFAIVPTGDAFPDFVLTKE